MSKSSVRHLISSCVAVAAAVLGAPGAARAGCPATVCGGNSPVLYGQKINGLHTGGLANADGHFVLQRSVRLAKMRAPHPWWMPKRIAQAGSPAARRLRACDYVGWPGSLGLKVVDGAFVIYVLDDPAREYRGACLKGASFDVAVVVPPDSDRSGGAPQQQVVRLEVADTHAVATWHQDDRLRTDLPMYRIVGKYPSGAPAESICEEKKKSFMEVWQVDGLGGPPRYLNPGNVQGWPWRLATDMAILGQGEVYIEGRDGRLGLYARDPQWFQIACAGSAVSKLRLLGFDLNDGGADWNARRSTLNMLSARFDGQHVETKPGMPLQYERIDNGVRYFGSALERTIFRSEPEAIWGPDGALCVSHVRTWQHAGFAGDPPTPSSEQEHVETIRGRANVAACSESPPAGAVWATFPVEHVRH